MKIRAAVSREKEAPFTIEEIDISEPRHDEVLVRVVGAGVCHTDLICRDQWYPVPQPAVFGHEGSGIVEAVGESVTKLKPGDHVVMSFMSCGHCNSCKLGHPAYCSELYERNFSGTRPDGTSALSANGEPLSAHFFAQSSWATYAMGYERSVVKVDPTAPLELLGPLGCGVQTGAGAVFNILNPKAGTSIAVFGAGSVGLSAVMAAKAVGCTTIIAVDLKQSRLDLAAELGATHGINAIDVPDVVEAIRDLTGGGVDFSLELTANGKVFRSAIDSLAPLGTVGCIGATALGTEYSFDVNDLMLPGKTIKGMVEGDSIPDIFIPRLVELMARGQFPLEKLVTNYKLDEVNRAAQDAESGAAVKPILVFA
jgi:aryl-alcohol dehydrogenase